MKRPKQTELKLLPAGRGGWRPGAGRKAGPGARVLHRARGRVPGHCPVHVTVRVRRGIPRLRQRGFVSAFQRSLAAGCERRGFRVVQYSIQNDHLHFIIEAQGRMALGRGMKSLGARIGRCVNRVFRRSGKVLDGRYHHRVLSSPLEVRRALAYVLLNARHHHHQRHRRPPATVTFDAASSAAWFDGWKRGSVPAGPVAAPAGPVATPAGQRPPPGQGPSPSGQGPSPSGDGRPAPAHGSALARGSTVIKPVAAPRTWLLAVGWRRHRLIDPAEVPGAAVV